MMDALSVTPSLWWKQYLSLIVTCGFGDKKLSEQCLSFFFSCTWGHIAPSYIIYASSRCVLNIDYSVLLGAGQKVTLNPWISRGKMTARCLSAYGGWNEKDKLSWHSLKQQRHCVCVCVCASGEQWIIGSHLFRKTIWSRLRQRKKKNPLQIMGFIK